MGKVADIARIREILAENLLLRHKFRLLTYEHSEHRNALRRRTSVAVSCSA